MSAYNRCALAACLLLASARLSAAAEPKLDTDENKTMYALGFVFAQQLANFDLTAAELELVKAGLTDGVLGRPAKVETDTYRAKFGQLAQARSAALAEKEKKASAEFLAAEAAKKGAVKLDSGVIITEIKPGTGPSPTVDDTVEVNYRGTLRDGTQFDSSYDRGTPAKFPLKGVVRCWTEGLQKMKVGGKSRLVCPSDTAYGDRGRPPIIKPGATLVFEVELLSIADKGEKK